MREERKGRVFSDHFCQDALAQSQVNGNHYTRCLCDCLPSPPCYTCWLTSLLLIDYKFLAGTTMSCIFFLPAHSRIWGTECVFSVGRTWLQHRWHHISSNTSCFINIMPEEGDSYMYVLVRLLFLDNFSEVFHLQKKKAMSLNCETICTCCQLFGHEHLLGVRQRNSIFSSLLWYSCKRSSFWQKPWYKFDPKKSGLLAFICSWCSDAG